MLIQSSRCNLVYILLQLGSETLFSFSLTKSLHIVEHFSRPAVRCGAAWTAYYSGIMVTFSKAVKLQFYGSVDVGVTSDETLFSKLLGYKEVIVPSLYGSIPERLRPMIAPESPLNLSNLKIAIARLTCERENTFFKRWLEVSVQVNILEVYSSVDWHQTDWYGINCGRLSELVLCGDVDPELNLPTLKDFISRHSNLSTILIDIQSVRFCLANDFFQAADTALADSHPVHVSRMLFRRNINTLNSEFECTEITVDYSAYAADAGPFIELLADFFSQVKILHLTFSPESPAMEDTPPVRSQAHTVFSSVPFTQYRYTVELDSGNILSISKTEIVGSGWSFFPKRCSCIFLCAKIFRQRLDS